MTTPNHRMTPAYGAPTTISVKGRIYSCAFGSTIDVPNYDADIMGDNKWLNLAGTGGDVGPTSARPVNPYVGKVFIDTTISAVIMHLGNNIWTNCITGGQV